MGFHQFTRLLFGLSEARATFQQLMDKIITPELLPHAFAYLDDAIIATETFEKHTEALGQVLRCIKAAGLTINYKKSEKERPAIAAINSEPGTSAPGYLQKYQEVCAKPENFPEWKIGRGEADV